MSGDITPEQLYRHIKGLYDDMLELPMYWVVHPRWLPDIARARGFHVGPFERRRGIRGRKRALSVRRKLA